MATIARSKPLSTGATKRALIDRSGLRPRRIHWKGEPDAMLIDWLAKRFGAVEVRSTAENDTAVCNEEMTP